MELTIKLLSSGISTAKHNQLTRAFRQSIVEHVGIRADYLHQSINNQDPTVKHKGQLIDYQSIVIELLASGTVVAIIDLIKAYISRDKSIEIELQRKDGNSFRINSKNVNTDKLEKFVKNSESVFEQLT